MAKKIKRLSPVTDVIHCACLIHDRLYDWVYVDRLYNSLCRNLTPKVILHVFTEGNRPVPEPYVKHSLTEWPGIRGPKQSWWYKVQIFNPKLYKGHLLYFDLDTVITGNLDWIWQKPKDKFWSIRDFKFLFRGKRQTINSSVMWFSTEQFSYVYHRFDPDKVRTTRAWHGDQDYITATIGAAQIGYLEQDRIKSYKWEIKEGGYDFSRRKHYKPGEITYPGPDVRVLIFHGRPKPHEEDHPIIRGNWL